MAQDTRKDPRAKVLSMTVRYRSATIDEFIEHHSHDVSRGGIFIKTPSPFPAGTLLKFEIRIQTELAVLAGVGRVVWKRESPLAAEDQPAGMGVKFIKIDDKSKALLSRLVESNRGPSAYDAGKPDGVSTPPPAAPGLAAAAPGQKRASTMLGLGAIGSVPPPRPDEPEAKPAAAKETGTGGFFPATNPEAEMPPPEERTVMKQAAELLQQALAEAGGSLEEIGAVAAKDRAPAKPDPEPARAVDKPRGAAVESPEGAAVESGKGNGIGAVAAAPERAPVVSATDAEVVAASAPETRPKVSSRAPRPVDSARPIRRSSSPAPVRAPELVSAKAADDGGSSKTLIFILVAAVLGGGAYVIFSSSSTTGTSHTLPPRTVQTTKPPETVKPVDTAPAQTAKPVETTTSKPVETATSKPVETAPSKPSETAKPAQPATTKPAETAKPAQPATTKPAETAKPAEAATGKPAETAKPAETSKPAETAKPATPPAPKPPAPKPKPADDPYG